jgi:hypothetical protein
MYKGMGASLNPIHLPELLEIKENFQKEDFLIFQDTGVSTQKE